MEKMEKKIWMDHKSNSGYSCTNCAIDESGYQLRTASHCYEYMETWTQYLVPIITDESLVELIILMVGYMVPVGLTLSFFVPYLANNGNNLSLIFSKLRGKYRLRLVEMLGLQIPSTSWLCLRVHRYLSQIYPMWYHPYPCGCSIEFRIPYESPVPVTTIPSDGVLNQI